jgi:DNA-binding MarR family transcriptional regulator
VQLFGGEGQQMEVGDAERLHGLMMELVRAGGLLRVDTVGPAAELSVSQAFALHELEVSPLSQQDLADRLQLEKSSVSRMAAEMERKGLLVRERDPDNRRQYRLRLTPQGNRAHAQMAGDFHQRYERWVAALTKAERAALLTALPALVRVMRAG